MIQHGVYHKNMRISYRGKIVSTSYVQDCRYNSKNHFGARYNSKYNLGVRYNFKNRLEAKYLSLELLANSKNHLELDITKNNLGAWYL